MHIPAFTAFLGITHQEYAHVFYREPLDRRVRDQIAYKLGVDWREIAEFMPAQPQTWPEIVPVGLPCAPALAARPRTAHVNVNRHNRMTIRYRLFIEPLSYSGGDTVKKRSKARGL